MIDYELAKQLKDAGYPMPIATSYEITDGRTDIFRYPSTDQDKRHWYVIPGIEELIKACGDRCMQFTIDKDGGWHAYNFIQAKTGRGDSLHEAVATLWLEITKV